MDILLCVRYWYTKTNYPIELTLTDADEAPFFMVEKELDTRGVTSPDSVPVGLRRRVGIGGSMVAHTVRVRRFARSVEGSLMLPIESNTELLEPVPYEWVAGQDSFPPFLTKLVADWNLSEIEILVHQAMAGLVIWDRFFCAHQTRLQSAQCLPEYVLQRIVPDVRSLIGSFEDDLGLGYGYVSNYFESAVRFIAETHRNGKYNNSSPKYMESSPILPFIRGTNPAFKRLYEDGVVMRHLPNPYKHSYFANKDRSFYGWVMEQLHQHYVTVR